jgi:hypothetical protein
VGGYRKSVNKNGIKDMKTPYLDKEIQILERGFKNKTNSFYQNRKLVEYNNIKELLKRNKQ